MRLFFSKLAVFGPVALTALLLFSVGPARAADPITIDADRNLFTVLAAINMAGYDDGIAMPDQLPLRRQLRDYLAKQNLEVVPELKQFYRTHTRRSPLADLSQYISFALSVNGPPDFTWRTRDVEVPPDAAPLASFSELVARFYRQANMADLWQKAQPALEAEMAKYHGPLVQMTGAVDGYLRVPAGGYLGRHFRVFVDPFGAPQQVQTRNYGDDAFVIVTSSAQPKLYDLRHAYLHFEVDPIVIKYGLDLAQKSSILDLVQSAPIDDHYKDDFVLFTTECLIKAIEARLDKDPGEAAVAVRQGWLLAQFFSEQLPVFEKQQQGLRFYVDDVVQAIDVKREIARAKTVKFDAAAPVRAARPVVVEAAPPSASTKLSAAGETLVAADDAYGARSLAKAKEQYLKALEQQGSEQEHAQAWYGLARISVLENEPEAAVKLFEKTLGASPDPQTKAWSDVYLARLARAGGDADAAAKFYKEALAVDGASERALEAARNESAELQPGK